MDKSEQIFELITKVNTNMSEIKLDFNHMKSEITDMKSNITDMKSEVTDMKSNITDMKSDIKETKSDIKDIQMTLENVTNKNIKIIAEGHHDLNKKLDNALKIENEKELLLIRLTVLENEVARIKARIEEIA